MQRSGRRPSQRELADHTGLEVIYISKLVRGLESAGLVQRLAAPRDARAVELSLTPAGKEAAEGAITVVHALLDDLTRPLGGLQSEETKSLVRTLLTLLQEGNDDANSATEP